MGCIHNEQMYQNNRRPIPAMCVFSVMGVFSAMHDVGTYRQVRPMCQLADGYVHKERMYRNHNRRLIKACAYWKNLYI